MSSLMKQHKKIPDPPRPRPKILCGLCKHLLSIPPVQQSLTKKFICGVCYSSKLYYPTEESERRDQVKHQRLFELYAENDNFLCMYENCEASFKFGSDSLKHRQTCKYRRFHCPLSPLNIHYIRGCYENCGFSTTKPADLFSHVEKKHPHLIKSEIETRAFWKRPCGLLVLPYRDFLSVVFIKAVGTHSLLVSCRQYKHDPITDKCVIKVVDMDNRKYVIQCSSNIGAVSEDLQKLLKNVAIFESPIEFSIVAKDVVVPNLTIDSDEDGAEFKKNEEDGGWTELKADSNSENK